MTYLLAFLYHIIRVRLQVSSFVFTLNSSLLWFVYPLPVRLRDRREWDDGDGEEFIAVSCKC
jgi:hypothetical protein